MSTAIAKNFQIGIDPTSTNNFTLYQPATPDGTLRLGNGNTGITSSLLTLTSAGNLGIGTSSPTTRLDVNGTATATALTVNGNNISAVNSLGFRNRIINGAMQIWQRGTTTGSVAGTTAPYMADRFYGFAGTGNITISRSADVPAGFQYSCSMVGTGVSITQRIESLNCVDLSGATVTVSFWAKSTAGTDNLTVSLYTATGGVDNYSSQTATTNTVSASPSGSWTYYTTTFSSIPSTATNGVGIGIGRGSGGSSTTLITGVQLEAGSVATPFERRDYGRELIMCQRYYEKSFAVDVAPANGVYSMGYIGYVCFADQWVFAIPTILFKVPKRAAPAISFFGTASNTWQINDNNNAWQNYAAVGTGFQASIGIFTTGFSAGVHNNGNSGYAIGSARMIRGDWTAASEL